MVTTNEERAGKTEKTLDIMIFQKQTMSSFSMSKNEGQKTCLFTEVCTLNSVDVVEGTWSLKPADLRMYYLRHPTVGCFCRKMDIHKNSDSSTHCSIQIKILY